MNTTALSPNPQRRLNDAWDYPFPVQVSFPNLMQPSPHKTTADVSVSALAFLVIQLKNKYSIDYIYTTNTPGTATAPAAGYWSVGIARCSIPYCEFSQLTFVVHMEGKGFTYHHPVMLTWVPWLEKQSPVLLEWGWSL